MGLKIKYRIYVLAALVVLMAFMCGIKADASDGNTNNTNEISVYDDVDAMFKYIHSKPIELYSKVNLNVRDFPNTERSRVIKVITPNTKVKEISEYDGWSKVLIGDDTTAYYVWNKYLSKDKVKVEKLVSTAKGEYLGKFTLTAYCSCGKCCGKWAGGNTASGTRPTPGRTVAMGGVPFGTKLLINGHVYTVEDRGTSYGHVDIFFGSHGGALNFGRKYADVYKVN